MLQQDVINSYRYALSHHLTLSLEEDYLQNSSLGSPYEKWKKFTNENFLMLSFSIDNLLRYTSRLVHDTEIRQLKNLKRYDEASALSNRYTGPICNISYHAKFIGIRILPDNLLELSRPIYGLKEYQGGPSYSASGIAGEPMHYCKTTKRILGGDLKEEISRQEYAEACSSIKAKEIDIKNRDALKQIRKSCEEEVTNLSKVFLQYQDECKKLITDNLFSPYEELNEGWWLGV